MELTIKEEVLSPVSEDSISRAPSTIPYGSPRDESRLMMSPYNASPEVKVKLAKQTTGDYYVKSITTSPPMACEFYKQLSEGADYFRDRCTSVGLSSGEQPTDLFVSPDEMTKGRMKKKQQQWLDDVYKVDQFPTITKMHGLAKELGLSPKKVLLWFKRRQHKLNQGHHKKIQRSHRLHEAALTNLSDKASYSTEQSYQDTASATQRYTFVPHDHPITGLYQAESNSTFQTVKTEPQATTKQSYKNMLVSHDPIKGIHKVVENVQPTSTLKKELQTTEPSVVYGEAQINPLDLSMKKKPNTISYEAPQKKVYPSSPQMEPLNLKVDERMSPPDYLQGNTTPYSSLLRTTSHHQSPKPSNYPERQPCINQANHMKPYAPPQYQGPHFSTLPGTYINTSSTNIPSSVYRQADNAMCSNIMPMLPSYQISRQSHAINPQSHHFQTNQYGQGSGQGSTFGYAYWPNTINTQQIPPITSNAMQYRAYASQYPMDTMRLWYANNQI